MSTTAMTTAMTATIKTKMNPNLVVVGSLGLDTIATPDERRENLLGGSVSYACAAASFYSCPGMVAVAGTDLSDEYIEVFDNFGIDQQGLRLQEGKTFHWEGRYHDDMNQRDTLCTDLNVFADFQPELPIAYRQVDHLFLANIAPELQLHVIDQVEDPEFVVADTMDLWIDLKREKLIEVIGRVDMLTLNEPEARHLTGESSLPKAAQMMLAMGPEYVLIKKGEHGCMLFSHDQTALLPAYPIEDVIDPTGAGDSFAGGLMGYITKQSRSDWATICEALLHGTIIASFTVEAFSLDALRRIEEGDIEARLAHYKEMLL